MVAPEAQDRSEGSSEELLGALFEEYLERCRRGERPSAEEFCERHPQHAERIRAVFRTADLLGDIRAEWSGGGAEPAADSRTLPSRIGAYRIVRLIGRGGMGVVYEAEHEQLGRRVALKALPASRSDPQSRARFEREQRAAAKLHNTNIVPVFDVGYDGEHVFYTMQLIEGQSLDRVIREVARLRSLGEQPEDERSAQERAADGAGQPTRSELDPSAERLVHSVSLSLVEGRFRPTRALAPGDSDSGSAAVDESSTASLSTTAILAGAGGSSARRDPYHRAAARIALQVADALAYSHARGVLHRDIKPSNLLLDTSGVVWITDFGLAKAAEHEDLTHSGDVVGTLRYMSPERFDGRCDERADVYGLGLTLYELLALRSPFESAPRARLIDSILHDPPPRLRSIDRWIPADLETIVTRAIDKDPARRYQRASDLAGDLRRFLEDQPISARRVSAAERTWRWMRRNRGLATSLGAVAFLLVVLMVGSIAAAMYFREESQARAELAATNRELAESRLRDLYFAEMLLAVEAAPRVGGIGRIREVTERWLPELAGSDLRGWEWRYLRSLCFRERWTARGHREAVWAVDWSPDARRIASAGHDHTIRIWDAETAQEISTLAGSTESVRAVAWSPDGTRLLSADAEHLRLWDTTTLEQLREVRLRGWVDKAAWRPDGALLAALAAKRIYLWAPETDASPRERFVGEELHALAWSSDSRRLAVGSEKGRVLVYALGDDAEPISFALDARVESVDWSSRGPLLAVACADGIVAVFDVESRTRLWSQRRQLDPLNCVRWRPDGSVLAEGGWDRRIVLRDGATGKLQRTLRGHTDRVLWLRWSPGGDSLLSSSYDGELKLWDTSIPEVERVLEPGIEHVWCIAWRPDGERLAVGGQPGELSIWSAADGRPMASWKAHSAILASVMWSGDGERLATGGFDTRVRIWRAEDGELLHDLAGHESVVWSVCFRPDGRLLASTGGDFKILLWDASSGARMGEIDGQGPLRSIAWRPDGARIASTGVDGTLRVWSPETGEELLRVAAHSRPGFAVCWSPDGASIATGSADHTIAIWDASEGTSRLVLRGHTAGVRSLSWSRDGARLASASDDGTVKLWDLETGQLALSLVAHSQLVRSVAWDREGQRLASGSWDGTARIFDPTAGKSRPESR